MVLEIRQMTSEELKDKYFNFLEQNIKEPEAMKIALRCGRTLKTVWKFIKFESEDILVLRAIIEYALDVLKENGVIYDQN